MAKKMLVYAVQNEKIVQFQVVYMYYPVMNQNEAFISEVEKHELGIQQTNNGSYQKKVLNKDNTCVISLMIFYENRNTTLFKVLCLVIYFIMDNYLCGDCLCLYQDQLPLEYKLF